LDFKGIFILTERRGHQEDALQFQHSRKGVNEFRGTGAGKDAVFRDPMESSQGGSEFSTAAVR
jgi:hypothetical protein